MAFAWTVFVFILGVVATVYAQGPPQAPLPGEKCLVDIQQWISYAGVLKGSRDDLERTIAGLNLQLDALKKKVAELEKK